MRSSTPLTRIGKALAHPLRERMLRLLADSELCGCEFSPLLGVDPSIVSRYLAILERAGLVASRREGVRVMWRLADPRLLQVLEELAGVVGEKVV
ncbi:MAG: metalloregulator ArsR/SmtB family transcription factor [Candidatus Bipolaricaulis sp.]|nr:metalloregulator ArsR/SmtB family transcription factor [Candidatus Bipolaricaulis sp.]